MKTTLIRLLCLLAALSLIALSAIILVVTGLPERANYTGQYISGLGQVAPEIGAFAPPIELALINGDVLSLEELRGRYVVLNFWATWCIPCQTEMPELQQLYEENAIDAYIIGINLGEALEDVRTWIDQFDLTFHIAIDANRNIERLYQVRGQPSTYVITPDGYIKAIYYGPVTMNTLRQQLQS